jgi:predicted O-linked N-acetylglucosamine transferase (SPINDLY family)
MLDAEFTERFVRLPGSFMISDESIASCAPTQRAIHGLPEKAFVFVNFNQNSRIDRGVFEIWMEILATVPDSVLWLKHSNDLARENLRTHAASKAIEPHRLVFAPDVPDKSVHVARLRLADLGLDTIGRYNGHTSTADALWAGVPVVTTATDCFPGRVAASLLSASGMDDCVANDVSAYKAFAVRYALDRGLQQTIRSRLAAARNHAPFFRPEGVVGALESAYTAMWERCKTGREPAAIDLDPS